MRPDRLALVLGEQEAHASLPRVDVEMVEPEVGQHFLELPLAVDRAQHLLFLEFLKRLRTLRRPHSFEVLKVLEAFAWVLGASGAWGATLPAAWSRGIAGTAAAPGCPACTAAGGAPAAANGVRLVDLARADVHCASDESPRSSPVVLTRSGWSWSSMYRVIPSLFTFSMSPGLGPSHPVQHWTIAASWFDWPQPLNCQCACGAISDERQDGGNVRALLECMRLTSECIRPAGGTVAFNQSALNAVAWRRRLGGSGLSLVLLARRGDPQSTVFT